MHWSRLKTRRRALHRLPCCWNIKVGDDGSAEVDSGADTEVATAALVTADAEVDAVVADDAATADVGSEFDARAGEGSTSGDVEGRPGQKKLW